MKLKLKPIVLSIFAAGLSSLAATTVAQADDSFYEALTGGKVGFSARPRYESVKQDNALKDADAYTIRTTLNYKTGAFHGFKGFVEIEDVSDLGSARYNSTTNGETDYSVVADPSGTEVNQAYLQYTGFDTEFRFGRQQITYRGAPFHRFIGNVIWRQNQQTYDGLSIANTSIENLKLSYAYLNKVHTIFGDDRTVGLIKDGEIDMNSHLFNVQYTGLPIGKLEAYSYLLDYEAAPDNNPNSTATYGIRFSGAKKVSDDFKAIYTAEYANQDDYADGEMDDQNYYLAELGGKYKGWMAKFSYEMQEGDGTYSFKTPLGTNHAFQGWSDQFLSTPNQGLEDMYFTVLGNVMGVKVLAVYHDFETDQGGLDAGDELNLQVSKTFMKHYTLAAKYADYDAGDASLAKVDTEKFWIWGQVKF